MVYELKTSILGVWILANSSNPLGVLETSLTFCRFAGSLAGLGFLSLYLSGKIKAFDRRGHVAKLCIVFLPLLFAYLVAISRINDYWHHWEDVLAGGLLGLFNHILLLLYSDACI